MEAWLQKIEKIAANIATQEGCELYDLEFVGTGNGRVLRVFIDKDSGIVVEDCSGVSKGLNEALDSEGEDFIPGGPYHLEVSSPGLDRHLKTLRHFQKVVGQKVFVQLSQPLSNFGAQDKGILSMKKFDNVLDAVEGENLIFTIRSEKVQVPFSAVEKGKLVFEMKTNMKPTHPKKNKK